MLLPSTHSTTPTIRRRRSLRQIHQQMCATTESVFIIIDGDDIARHLNRQTTTIKNPHTLTHNDDMNRSSRSSGSVAAHNAINICIIVIHSATRTHTQKTRPGVWSHKLCVCFLFINVSALCGQTSRCSRRSTQLFRNKLKSEKKEEYSAPSEVNLTKLIGIHYL